MTDDTTQVAVLSDRSRHPVLLRGVDHRPVSAIRLPNAFRDTIYLLSPGPHVLWVSSVPYGHPRLPQTVRCYVLRAHFERGARYVLEEDPDNERVRMRHEGSDLPAASGQRVDKAPVFLRDCRWQSGPAQDAGLDNARLPRREHGLRFQMILDRHSACRSRTLTLYFPRKEQT